MLYYDELLPISYLNDFLFCERRAAMHVLEQVWRDNQYTVEGSFAHRNVDLETNLKRGDKRNVTGMWLVSYRLGLIGKADLIEFREVAQPNNSLANSPVHPVDNPSVHSLANPASGVSKPTFVPYPIDFKRGKKRRWDNNEVQLCAQALCLEEMLEVDIPAGAIFHIKSQRREEVHFNQALRQKTESTVKSLRNMIENRVTPSAKFQPKCRGCSLMEWCLPKSLRPRATAKRYLESLIADLDIPPSKSNK